MNQDWIEIATPKHHWSHYDVFNGIEQEFIKSFVHRNYAIGIHTHEFFEINIVLSGEGRHYIEENCCDAKVGSVFVIPPNIKHGYVNIHELDIYHMLIHRDFIEQYMQSIKKWIGYVLLFEIEPYLRNSFRQSMFLVLSKEELSTLQLESEHIMEYNKRSVLEREILINITALKIISRLCFLMTDNQDADSEVNSRIENNPVMDCLKYIHLNYEEKITIDGLAALGNMSRSTFLRKFGQVCNCSPVKYLIDYRLKKAKELLEHSDKTMSDIAQECGFYDVSHLKKHLNHIEYRNSRYGCMSK